MLRAAAIPSLGYLLGWGPQVSSSSISSDEKGATGQASEVSSYNESGNESGNQEPKKQRKEDLYDPNAPIYRLMNNPTVFEPTRAPRNPIVLAHGLYGFDVRGFSTWPSLQIHYWSDVLGILRKKVGAEVIVTRVPSTGSIQERAKTMHDCLQHDAAGRSINFIAHSMGGLDCRQLISNIKPKEYTPLTLTTVSTPHRGSPFMDWLMEIIGIGSVREPIPGIKPVSPAVPLPSSIISFIDSPAYSNLTSNYLKAHFNPSTPDSPNVRYWSVAARTPSMSFFHPLWLPKLILDGYEEKVQKSGKYPNRQYGNDGLVTVESAKWGEFLGVLENCDHWDMRGAGGLSAHHADEAKGAESAVAGSGSNQSTWSWTDWQRFLGVWNQDKSRRDQAALQQQKLQEEDGKARRSQKAQMIATLGDSESKEKIVQEANQKEGGQSPMDSVLDWVVENVPGINAVTAPLKLVTSSTSETKEGKPQIADHGSTKPPRFDLERFYVALSRKLYDEGY